MAELLLLLLCGHAVMDFWAQSHDLAKMKNRNRAALLDVPPGQKRQVVWPYALTCHAIHHGVSVGYLTGSYALGISEAVCHWVIDFGKCENWYGIHADQTAHVACKVVWVLVVVYG